MQTNSRSRNRPVNGVGAIVLAAGGSSRLGGPKQLLQYHGRSFLRRAADVAIASGMDPIVVVLGGEAERLAKELAGLPVGWVSNPDWPAGMGSSIRTGMRALPAGIKAVVITLCDQPFVRPKVLTELIKIYQTTGSGIVASEYEGTLGPPALFTRLYFSQLADLPNETGAKALIRQAGAAVYPFPAGAIDIDSPQHYDHLQFLARTGHRAGCP